MHLDVKSVVLFVCVGLTVESILSGIDVKSVVLFRVCGFNSWIHLEWNWRWIHHFLLLCVWVQQLHLFYVSLIQSSVFYSNILGLCMHYRTLEVPRWPLICINNAMFTPPFTGYIRCTYRRYCNNQLWWMWLFFSFLCSLLFLYTLLLLSPFSPPLLFLQFCSSILKVLMLTITSHKTKSHE